MKSEDDKMLCYICGKATIRRMCLAEEIIANGKFLFCDSCRKQQILRKHGSQIYEIDSYSAPISLLSINSSQKEEARKVNQSLSLCSLSAEQNLGTIYQLLMSIDEKILQKAYILQSTFNSQTAQHMEEQLKNHSSGDCQHILKRVKTLKWVKENKEFIQNASILSQRISTFAKDFQVAMKDISTKMEDLIMEFMNKFNMDNLFTEKKKDQKSQSRPKDNLTANKNTKKSKPVEKESIKKPLNDQIKPEKSSESIRQERLFNNQDGMEVESSNVFSNVFDNLKSRQIIAESNQQNFQKIIFPSISIKDDISINDGDQKLQKEKSPSQNKQTAVNQQKNIKKKTSKPPLKTQASSNEEQTAKKPQPIVLEKVLTKSDYPEKQKLIISLKNIAEIFWALDESEKKQKPFKYIQDPKVKYENGIEKIVEQRSHLNNLIDTSKIINLKAIKYLEIRELPKRSVQIFTVNIQGQETKVKYSIEKLFEKVLEMDNLEQLHIFTSFLFPSEEQLLTVLFTCSNIKVVSFCCFNPTSKMLNQFKQMVGDQLNQQIKVLEIAGNIPFYENIEIADTKCYYPQSQKNKKIFDQKFAKQFERYVEDHIKYSEEKVNQKQKFEHRNSCWFVPHNKKQIQIDSISNILTSTQNNLLQQCFKELRSCWIPQMSTQQLTQKQSKTQIQKVQHLTLGFHNFVLQPIPEIFYYGEKNNPSSVPFCKFLTNLKSLNLINLNINQFFMRSKFCPNWKELVSLKIQNCVGLSNIFFKNLPKYCPKLRKICVNNLQAGIQGDFLTKLEQLETIILPWSELSYNRSQKISEIENERKSLIEEINEISAENINSFKLKKWKYVNLYGCTWFHTDFFALIDPEQLEHLNIGIEDLIYYLKRFSNLESLCLDEIQLNNQDLFGILRRLPKLTKLSVAHCPNLNFTFNNLSSEEVYILDRMTHLDVRNWVNHIAFQYTMKMTNPKYLIISRGFQLDQNEPQTLAQRQIIACSSQI